MAKKAATTPRKAAPRRARTPQGLRIRNAEIRRVRVGEIRDNPKNHRTHGQRQRDSFQATVDEVGWYGYPDVYVDPEAPEQFTLVDGELRAHHLTEHYGQDAAIDVNVTDFDQAEADKALATKDALSAMAGIEEAKLRELLAGLEPDCDDFAKLISQLTPDETTDDVFSEDETPEATDELLERWGVEPGDLYEITGNAMHRVKCGSSTNPDDVRELLAGAEPFIMVTDPPYGVDYKPDWRHAANLNNSERVGRVTADDRFDWTEAYNLFPGVVAYVWHAGRFTGELILSLDRAEFQTRNTIIWKKPAIVIGRGHYHWQHEPCLYAKRGGNAKWRGGQDETTIWEISNRIQDTEHKSNHGTQKPIECMGRPLRNHGGHDDAVYDPFLGTGTTIVAANRLGRAGYGMEIEPSYMAVILERLHLEGCGVEKQER